MMIPCYDADRLRRFLRNRLPEPEQAVVAAHVERCPRCQRKLDRLTGDPPSKTEFGPLTLPAAADGPPAIPGYAVEGRLGHGGTGVVYRAREARPARVVALKLLRDGVANRRRDRRRFLTDAEALARLQHPNIVPVYQVRSHRGRPFFTMEYAAGGDLETRVGDAALPPEDAARITETLARAVHYAHQRGVIHCDLKPSNILLTVSPERAEGPPPDRVADWVPKVADFGLAKLLGGAARRAGPTAPYRGVRGTIPYMAPEQAAGRSSEIGTRTDVHALGGILYRLLTGRPPYDGESDEAVLGVICSADQVLPPGRLRPGIPADLEQICQKCLAKEPGKRYASAEQLADELRRFLAREPLRLTRAVGPAERVRLWVRRNRALTAALAVALAAVVAAFSMAVYVERAKASAAQRETDAVRREAARDAADAHAYRLRYAEALWDQALGRLESGEPRLGLLGLARALEAAPDDAADLRRAIRLNLAAWRDTVPRLAGPPLEHPGDVGPVALSPDGLTALTACSDGTVLVWETAGWTKVGQLDGHVGGVRAVAAAGGRAVTAGRDGVRVWDLFKQAEVCRLTADETFAAALSPDGRTAVLAGATRVGVWDVEDGRHVRDLPHPCGVRGLAWSPRNPELVVTGGEDGQVRLWNPAAAKPFRTLAVAQPVRAVAFSPDGLAFATTGYLQAVVVWDAGGQEVTRVDVKALVTCVAFAADNRTLVIGTANGSVQRRDRNTRELTGALLPHREPVQAVACGHAGVLTASGRVARVWAPTTGPGPARTLPHPEGAAAAVFGAGGEVFTCGGIKIRTAGEFRRWGPGAQNPLAVGFPGPVRVLAVSPDGKTVLAGSGDDDGTVTLCDATTGCPLRSFPAVPVAAGSPGGRGVVTGAGFTPDGGKVFAGTARGGVYLGDVTTGAERELERDGVVWATAVGPDGRHVAAGGASGTRVWTAAGHLVHRLAPDRVVRAVAFSPDGWAVASGYDDGACAVHDVASGRVIWELRGHYGKVNRVAFSPCGRFLLTGGADAIARLFDLTAAESAGRALPHGGPVLAVAFSPDGRTVLTGAGGPTPGGRLWDARTGTPLGPRLPHSYPVTCAGFDPTGAAALTAGSDTAAKLWAVPAPVDGNDERVRLWVEVATGLEPDGDGGARELDATTWRARHGRLTALGGAPR